jgi:hypothetical protein
MKIELEPHDYDEIRDMTMGNLDFVPTNDQIDRALDSPELDRNYVIATAASYGWNETETRDTLCAALEAL